MARLLLCFGAVLLTAVPAPADDAAPSLSPAARPVPALIYRLLPDLRTQTPGDAVPVYKDAIDKSQPLVREAFMQPNGYPFPNWTHKDLADFPREKARKEREP